MSSLTKTITTSNTAQNPSIGPGPYQYQNAVFSQDTVTNTWPQGTAGAPGPQGVPGPGGSWSSGWINDSNVPANPFDVERLTRVEAEMAEMKTLLTQIAEDIALILAGTT